MFNSNTRMNKNRGDVKKMLRQPISNSEKEHNKYFDNEFPLESSYHVQNLSPLKITHLEMWY